MSLFYKILVLTSMMNAAAVSVWGSDALVMDPDEYRIASEPAVGIDDDGGTVVVWASQVAEGAQPLNGIRIRRFDASGHAVGEMFRIDVLPGDLARKPSVDITPDGSRFVVVWEGGTEGKRTKRRIWARVFDSEARPLGVEFRVDQRRMTHEQWGLPRSYYRDPKVSIAPNGEFVVVWRSEGTTSCDRFNISARRFSPAGEPLGNEFIVNTDKKWSQLNPDIDHDASGGFVVVWQGGRFIGTDQEWSGIHGRVFGAEGGEGGSEFSLSPYGSETAALPSLAVTKDGYIACAWKTGNGDEPLRRIEAGAFDSSGTLIGDSIGIEPEKPGVGGPHVTIVGPTEIMVAWAGTAEDRLNSPAVMARIFDVFGTHSSEPFTLSPATCWGVTTPVVTAAYGEFGAVVWKIHEAGRIGVRRFVRNSPSTGTGLNGGGETIGELVDRSRGILGDHREEDQRHRQAAEVLSCLRSAAEVALPDLVACVDGDFASGVKAECAEGIAAVARGPAQAVPTLARVIGDKRVNADVRSRAALAVAVFGGDAGLAIPALIEELQSEDSEVRGNMALALGRIGAVEAIDAMETALDLETPHPFHHEMESRILTGVGEFGENEGAVDVVSKIMGSCYYGFEAALSGKWRGRSDPRQFKWFFLDYLRKHGMVSGEKMERSTEHAVARFREGRMGVFERPLEIEYRRFFEGVDGVIRDYVEDCSTKVLRSCGCLEFLALGLSEVERFPELAASRLSKVLRIARSTPCLPRLLEIAGRLGPGDPGVVETIVSLMGDRDVPALEAIRALEATDPSCDECIIELWELLVHPDPEVREAAVGALIAAGLQAILSARDELTGLLEDDSSEVRARAEQALALFESESDVCDGDWRRVPKGALPPPVGYEFVPGGIGRSPEGPESQPDPPQRSGPVESGQGGVQPAPSSSSPPAGSGAEAPRPVRTPVGGHG